MKMKRTILIALLVCLALPMLAADDVNKMIRANTEVFDSAMRAGDVDGFMGFYAKDAVLMPPNAPAFNGADNVRKFWSGLLSMGKADVDLITDDVLTSGDLAIERGHFELTTPFKDSGKYIVVWRKRNGKWQIVDDIFNSSLAAPAPAAQ
jgi:ketosteroid isomerase-like protein